MSLDDIPPLSSADFEALLKEGPMDDGLLPFELLDPHPAPWLDPSPAGKLRWSPCLLPAAPGTPLGGKVGCCRAEVHLIYSILPSHLPAGSGNSRPAVFPTGFDATSATPLAGATASERQPPTHLGFCL